MDMNNDQILTLLIDLKSLVAGIASKLESTEKTLTAANNMLIAHEHRLTKIEASQLAAEDATKKEGLVAGLVPLLVKGLVAAVLTIGSLTGASALIKQVWTPEPAPPQVQQGSFHVETRPNAETRG